MCYEVHGPDREGEAPLLLHGAYMTTADRSPPRPSRTATPCSRSRVNMPIREA